jgi:aldehyde dehydrogenase (NAD+)
MDIDKVAFTGSTLVGRIIMKAAADSNLKKVTLELGGKSPNIIFNDADIDKAIEWANMGIFFNHGQTCCAGSRIYVQEGIYDEFVEKFKKRIEKNVVGDPFHDATFQGPQVSKLQFDRVMSYIEHGKAEGAKVEIGGKRKGDVGYFIEPTIFSNVKTDMKIMQEVCFPTKLSAKTNPNLQSSRKSSDLLPPSLSSRTSTRSSILATPPRTVLPPLSTPRTSTLLWMCRPA